MDWYEVENIEDIDSPAFLVYPDRVRENIDRMIEIAGSAGRLRPHVKTYKMSEVVQLQREAGIDKFKCATIAEAEMLGVVGASQALLAYQPYGPKIARLIALIKAFPKTHFSTLIDNIGTAQAISNLAIDARITIDIYIDLDTGNHRTGISPGLAFELYKRCQGLKGIDIVGLHAYDGHLRQSDFAERKAESDQCFEGVKKLRNEVESNFGIKLEVIAGGSPTFPCHAHRDDDIICSPGTSLFWDWGYGSKFPDLDFSFAALVITRVISKVGKNRITLDLGHKSIASENPFPRVHFLNMNEGKQISHSEEHLVIEVHDNSSYHIGQVFYGVPIHICPTTALYEKAHVVHANKVDGAWKVVARDRTLSI